MVEILIDISSLSMRTENAGSWMTKPVAQEALLSEEEENLGNAILEPLSIGILNECIPLIP
jgi:hypothetical protein